MSHWSMDGVCETTAAETPCQSTRDRFSAYLDGALDGRSMAVLAAHLESCDECGTEFAAWRSMQEALGDLGRATAPGALQAQLRDVLAGELTRRSYLSPMRRGAALWQRTLAPIGLRMCAGMAAALVLIGSLAGFLGSAAPVQANDDKMADLHPPRYLYSHYPAQPIATSSRFVAVLVDAKVDARGHVYDYDVIEGPSDADTRSRIEANLLDSVFKPATVFGAPVPGHAVITYTAVSVRG